MEQAQINKIINFSNVDGPGNRMAIFFQTCPFSCLYCHNPETINACISCGKCLEVCPVGIYPAFIMKNIGNIKELECLKADECIECGLCSYICPSKIEVREFVKAAKEKVDNK